MELPSEPGISDDMYVKLCQYCSNIHFSLKIKEPVKMYHAHLLNIYINVTPPPAPIPPIWRHIKLYRVLKEVLCNILTVLGFFIKHRNQFINSVRK